MKDRLDAIGIGLSSLCLIHCLLLPVLVIAVPSLVGSVLGSEWIHILLISAALPISIRLLARPALPWLSPARRLGRSRSHPDGGRRPALAARSH